MRMSPLQSALPILTVLTAFVTSGAMARQHDVPAARTTTVSIQADRFLINGQPTLKGVVWRGHKVEGLLPNSRMVQGVFDDLNPETRARWAYPDTKSVGRRSATRASSWPRCRSGGAMGCSPSRSTSRAAAPRATRRTSRGTTRRSPRTGRCGRTTCARSKQILDEADRLGMVVILGLFYFGQDERLRDEAAVLRAVDGDRGLAARTRATGTCSSRSTTSATSRYDHAILQPARVHELIDAREADVTRDGRRLLVSTSYGGNTVPGDAVARRVGLRPAARQRRDEPRPHRRDGPPDARSCPRYTPKPILFNEDDHYDFEKPWNNFVAATSAHASWGFFDFRRQGEGLGRGLPERARQLGHLVGPQARVLQPAAGDDGRTLTGGRKGPRRSRRPP